MERLWMIFACLVLLHAGCKKADRPDEDPDTPGPEQSGFVEYRVLLPSISSFAPAAGDAVPSGDRWMLLGGDRLNSKNVITAFKPDSVFYFSKRISYSEHTGVPEGLTADGAGGVFVVGSVSIRVRGNFRQLPFLARIDANGALLWSHYYDAVATDKSLHVGTQSLFNQVNVTEAHAGTAILAGSNLVAAVNAQSGELLWVCQFPYVREINRTVIDAEGITVFGNVNGRVTVVRLDWGGTKVWSRRSSLGVSAGIAYGRAARLGDGNVLLPYLHKDAAYRIPSYGILKISADGELLDKWGYMVTQNPGLESRPYHLFVQPNGSLWLHATGQYYLGQSQYRTFGQAFTINIDGDPETPYSVMADVGSFISPVGTNEIFYFDGGRVFMGLVNAACVERPTALARRDTEIDFGQLETYDEPITAVEPEAIDLGMQLEDLGAVTIVDTKNCE